MIEKLVKKHDWYDCYWEFTHRRNGKVIWKEKKRNALVDEGERAVLLNFFRDEEPPTQFYIRLGYDSIVETDTLVDVRGEPSGNGYAPILIERSATGFPVIELDAGDYRLTSKTVTFVASGGDIGPVNLAYLATTSDNSGKLLAFIGLSIERTVLDGDELDARMRIKLK